MSSEANFGKPKKHLGQNFLKDQTAVFDFLEFCKLGKNDNVLEIGIGDLALTKPLCNRVKKVVGIEIDPQLVMQAKLEIKNSKLKIICIDFLQLDLTEIIRKERITSIVSAIPYNITSPIIHKIIRENSEPLKSVNLITQKEFAHKILGHKDKRSYFTNLIEKYGNIEKGNIIKNTSFNPIPKVDSMFFKISILEYPKNINQVLQWEKFLHYTFKNPRKKLNKAFTEEKLKKLSIDPNLRPQNLSLKQLNKLNDRAIN